MPTLFRTSSYLSVEILDLSQHQHPCPILGRANLGEGDPCLIQTNPVSSSASYSRGVVPQLIAVLSSLPGGPFVVSILILSHHQRHHQRHRHHHPHHHRPHPRYHHHHLPCHQPHFLHHQGRHRDHLHHHLLLDTNNAVFNIFNQLTYLTQLTCLTQLTYLT